MKFPRSINRSRLHTLKVSGRSLGQKLSNTKQFGFFQKIYSRLSKIDKVLLVFFASLLLTSSSLWILEFIKTKAQIITFASADYIEGMVAQSRADIEPTINRLTKIGLVDFSENGEIIGVASTDWKIEDNGKKYTFNLKSEITADDILQAENQYKTLFPKATITSGNNQITFELEQSFSPFLDNLTVPIFDYGMFYLKKADKNSFQFLARENSLAGKAQLQELVLKIYPDTQELTQALQKKEISAISGASNLDPDLLENMNIYTIELPRKIYLFFNNSTKELDLATRKALKNKTKLSKSITLEIATLSSEPHMTWAQKIKEDWEELGAEITILAVTPAELTTQVIPNRQYDALIYGIDLGYGLDLYPFWHSSQISEKGLNFANFANVEADKILEEARQTTDTAKKQTLSNNLRKILDQEIPAIELEDLVWQFATPKNILGIKSHTGYNPADRFMFIDKWHK